MDPKFLRNQRYARKHNKKNGESATEEYKGTVYMIAIGLCRVLLSILSDMASISWEGFLSESARSFLWENQAVKWEFVATSRLVGWIRLGSCLASHLEFLKYVGNAQNNWGRPKSSLWHLLRMKLEELEDKAVHISSNHLSGQGRVGWEMLSFVTRVLHDHNWALDTLGTIFTHTSEKSPATMISRRIRP
uniref:Uncharacterized protein n=1 Tax=Salix viminalis TaxID=40686 RepID=A0A6N2M1L4_SALVM